MIRFLVILFCLAGGVAGEEIKSPTQSNFLFVIDTSATMASRKGMALEMVQELVTSGFLGQARNGDSIDIWTYNERNHITGFPPQIWTESKAEEIAGKVTRFIDQLKFAGSSRFASIAADLELLVPNTRRLLVVLLTDAPEPLSRIRYDLEINDYVGKLKRGNMNPSHPFLISLTAVNGELKGWAVYNGDGQDDLALLPARPQTTVAQATQRTKAQPEPKKKEPEKKTESEQRPIVWELPPGARISAPIVTASAPVPSTKPKAAPPKAQEQPRKAPEQPVEAPALAVVEMPSKVEGAKSNAPAMAVKGSVETPTPPADTESMPSLKRSAIPASAIYGGLGLGGLCIMGVGGLLVMRKMRARHTASIISRSLLHR